MKKILPIATIIAAGALLAGCSANMNLKKEQFVNNLNAFKQDLQNYTNLNENNLSKAVFSKYNLTISENLDDIDNLDNTINELEDNTQNNTVLSDNTANTTLNEQSNTDIQNEIQPQNDCENGQCENISTLYTLSNDIEESCDEFCSLKTKITEAIVETQNLINKVQQKEIELTKEQRMFITEQSQQLKALGRNLSNITTELSFHLSDLNQVMATKGNDLDQLNLKYLIVLDNLVNGNEMLQSSLSSLNLINQMFNITSPAPSNNYGRVLYGFKQNNNPPVIKDYYINEEGNLVENTNQNTPNTKTEEENSNTETEDLSNKSQTNIDTYQNTALNSNIDTYYNTNTPRNIDTFFNTALLDNEFMYGNGAYGYGGFNGVYGNANPYMNNYANYERNTTNSANNTNNTQNTENKQTKKEKKRIKLKKNIDTYKDKDEPDIKVKLGNIKNTITGFFTKFKGKELNDKIDNPVYRYNANDGEEVN